MSKSKILKIAEERKLRRAEVNFCPLMFSIVRLLLIFLFFSLLTSHFSLLGAQPTPKVAILKDIKGDVQVQKAQTKKWIPATENMKIYSGDKIKTKARSEAKIVWDDGNIVKLSSYTDFLVNKSVVDKTTGADTTSTYLSVGKTFINIKRAMAPGSSFEVSTPSAICGVRSTKFKVEVDSKGDTIVATYEGTVYKVAQGVEKKVSAGNKVKTEKGKPPQDEEPQDELDKIEQEEEAADVIGMAPEKPITLTVESPASDIDTEEDKIKIAGITDPDAKLLINGVGVSLNAFGRFEMEVKLNEGENTITITATNPAGKTITITRKVKRKKKEKPKEEEKDITPPILTISQPTNNTTVYDPLITIVGTTEANAKVTIKGATITAGSDGSFTHSITLVDGLNTITIRATDKAGNVTTTVLNVTLKIIPFFLTVSQPPDEYKTKEQTTDIIGFTEKDAKVTINGVPVYVDPSGSFTHTVNLVEGVNTFIIKAVSKNNEVLQVVKRVILVDVPPMPPHKD